MTTPTPTPLDAERARLREAGYTDDEISKYLVERLHGASQQSTAAGGAPVQGGIMSGVLGNASAAVSHARGAIPVLKADLSNLSNRTAPAKSRGKSALVLGGAALIVAVLCFAIYQEWQQHIVSATATAAAQAQKAEAEAAVAREVAEGQKAQAQKAEAEAAVAREVAEGQKAQARKAEAEAAVAREVAEGQIAQARKAEADAAVAKQLNDAQVQKLQAEAAAAKTLNDAQAEKLRAEADVAKKINEAQLRKTKAEECSARMKAAIDTVPMDQLGEATAAITRDCDPRYAECDDKFAAILAALKTAGLTEKSALLDKLESPN